MKMNNIEKLRKAAQDVLDATCADNGGRVMDNLKRLSIKHDYYCSESNFYSNEPAQNYETASDFLADYESMPIELNMCFRWDIRPRGDNGEKYGRYSAEIFIMLQRKGIFKPITIKHINESECVALEKYLKKHWEYLSQLWNPISNEHN